MQTEQTRQARLQKAKIRLLLDHPFFGTLATRLGQTLDPKIPTAHTNGKEIRWSPAFLDSLNDNQIMGVFAHEVLHVANGHTWRRGSRDRQAWNIAADKAINHILREAGFELPIEALWPSPSEAGKSAETLYEAPHSHQQGARDTKDGGTGAGAAQPSQQDGAGMDNGRHNDDPGGCGAVEDAPDGEAGAEEQKAEWTVAVAQAAAAAKKQGNLPAGLERAIQEIVSPKVPWATVLRDFVERSAENDYSWSQPNRRYVSQGFVLPSLISEELPEIVLAIDTSGSITQEDLDQFASEVSAVLGCYETTIRVVYCDATINRTETVTRADMPIRLKACGGGGTDFRPVFEWVRREALTPACLIYLTDGYGSFPTQEPDYPVLWVMTTDRQAPIGTTIQMEN